MRAPAAARTNIAAVETLNRSSESPPVPQTSPSGAPQPLTGTRTIFSRITDAIAASARGVQSDAWNAERNSAASYGAHAPSTISLAACIASRARMPRPSASRRPVFRSHTLTGFAGGGKRRGSSSRTNRRISIEIVPSCLPPVYHTGPPIIPLRRYPARGRRASSPATGRYLL